MKIYLWDGLLSIFGVGKTLGKYGCILLGRKRNAKLKDIEYKELSNLDKRLKRLRLIVTRLLERLLFISTNNLIETNAYRAVRANQGLPNRGQRTHSNAKTARNLIGLWGNSHYSKKENKIKIKRKFSADKKKRREAQAEQSKGEEIRTREKNKMEFNKNNKKYLEIKKKFKQHDFE